MTLGRIVKLEIDGQPVPKGRPRLAGGHVYTPGHTKAYEEVIGWAWKRQTSTEPFVGPLHINVSVFETKAQHPGDLDNYIKIALDALNGLAFADDRQIEHITARIERKSWAVGGLMEVTIHALSPIEAKDGEKQIDEAERLAELIEERRKQDGSPTFYGVFSFAQWLRGINEGRNPKDGAVQLRLT